MDKELFLDQSQASFFECSICLEVAHPAVLFPCEAHVFCRQCVANVQRCPQDREERAGKELLPLTKKLLSIYCSLRLKCPEQGCTWQGDLGDVDSHRAQRCPKTRVACAREGCGVTLSREDMAAHAQRCMYRSVNCPHCEGTMIANQVASHNRICVSMPVTCPSGGEGCPLIARSGVAAHEANDCAFALIACPYLIQGCQHQSPRDAMVAHKEGCAHRTIHCPHCQGIVIANQVLTHNATCPAMPLLCPSGGERCPPVARSGVAAHEASDCAFARMACPWSEYGCAHTCERRMMAAHHADGAASLAHLELVRIAIRDIHVIKTNVDRMTAGMDELRATVERLSRANTGLIVDAGLVREPLVGSANAMTSSSSISGSASAIASSSSSLLSSIASLAVSRPRPVSAVSSSLSSSPSSPSSSSVSASPSATVPSFVFESAGQSGFSIGASERSDRKIVKIKRRS